MIFTVVGIWDGSTPVPVGVIRGEHARRFDGELWWATLVEAADVDDAEREAVEEMRASLRGQED